MNKPPIWSEQELRVAISIAQESFIKERQGEGVQLFNKTFLSVQPKVEAALAATCDLNDLSAAALASNRMLWQDLRYFTAPPISEEDLWTLVGKKFKAMPAAYAESAAGAISNVLDLNRFGWVPSGRSPSAQERACAVMATTVLLTHETVKTHRRGASSRAQEDVVAEALTLAGLVFDPSRGPIASLDELPRNHFSKERKVGGAKCDIPVRLADGRLLAIECKVSNGPKNSWKRLQREVGGKADSWRAAFGRQLVTGAVLAGVFDLRCVVNAQNQQGVSIFWQHDLSPLADFVQSI